MFSCEFCDNCKIAFFAEHHRTTTSDIVVLTVVQGELENGTVNYYAEIKAYQFESKVRVVKKARPGERTGLTRVFEEGFRSIVRCDCQRYIPMLTEKR